MTRTQDGDAYLAICDKLPKPKWDITGSKEVLNELLDVFEKLAIYEETIDQLEAKAQELDRRENSIDTRGCHYDWRPPVKRYGWCGNCNSKVYEGFNYCSCCGRKVNFVLGREQPY